MSDNDSNSGVALWVILLMTIGLGLVFYFDHSMWPTLESPVLRCLIAPIVGALLMSFYSGLWVDWFATPVMKFIHALTTPGIILPVAALLLAGGGLALLAGWAPRPWSSGWAVTGGVTVGTLGGFIILLLASAVPHNPWHVRAVISLPVAGGLAYWMTNSLMQATEFWPDFWSIVFAVSLLARMIWQQEQVPPSRIEPVHVQPSYPLRAAGLPENVRKQLLQQIREQIGASQYNSLVAKLGEDGMIDMVLAQMKKGS